jgi:hypothetical protein
VSKKFKGTVLAITTVLSMSAFSAQHIENEFADDELGKAFIKNVTSQLSALKQQVQLLETTIADRQNAIDFLSKENGYRLFNVEKGSFKEQLANFARRLNIKTIRWSGVPECIDWELDSTYEIEMSDAQDAIDEFLDGMPLTYRYSEKDSSLNLTSTVIVQGCPDA